MHLDFCIVFIFSLSIFGAICTNDNKNDSIFVPTKEWQVVKKGTPIPKGLHVRHNFETGITEAKLMDKEGEEEEKKDEAKDEISSKLESKNEIQVKEETKSLTLHPEEVLRNHEDNAKDEVKPRDTLIDILSLDDLKQKLKKIKSDENPDYKPEKKKFQSYEELKNELRDLKMKISTDAELWNGLFKRFDRHREALIAGNLNSSKVDDILKILNNLEYLIHKIDNAQLFADLGGMSKIISPCLNSTNNEIKSESLRLLGAAVQSNPKVQLIALENDYVQKLLLMITTNQKSDLRSRCFFALSALVRQFPAAQKALVDHGGFEIFSKILNADQPSVQVQTRVMKLVNDLIIERRDLVSITDEEQRRQRIREYGATEFEKKLLIHDYCRHLVDLFSRSVKNVAVEDSDWSIIYDDLFEVIFESLITSRDICQKEYQKRRNEIINDIDTMSTIYKINAAEAPDLSIQEYFNNLLKTLKQIVVSMKHDEL